MMYLLMYVAFSLTGIQWLTPADHDFGSVPRGESVTHHFVYQNNTSSPLVIDNVRVTCGCTAPDWSTSALSPGTSDTLSIVFQGQKRGPFSKQIKVYFNVQRRAERLQISGTVE